MSYTDDSSFYLYGVGENPAALTLGSLVLEQYWQPLVARHYTHALLKDEDLDENVYSSTLKNCFFHGHTRVSPSVGVSGFDIVDLRLARSKDNERVITAKSGRRMILKDPETFLRTHVLTNPQAQSALKLWLSSARSKYLTQFKWARQPKVWFLTGLYVLEGTRTAVRKSTSSEIEIGLSSTFVSAISAATVPIGASISTGKGEEEWQLQMEMEEEHVWAAQYRLLDAKYLAYKSSGLEDDGNYNQAAAAMIMKMSLYKDILSSSTRRGGAPHANVVELSLTTETEERYEEQEEKAYEEYMQRLEDTICLFEKAPSRLLAKE